MAEGFGAWLSAQLSAQSGLQTQLSESLGLHSTYLSQLKSGAKKPSRARIEEIVKRLASLTDRDEDELIAEALDAHVSNSPSIRSLSESWQPRQPQRTGRRIRPRLGPLDLPVGRHALADEIAEDLVRRPTVHFQSLYSLPRSACWFVSYESREAEEKKPYEAEAWTDLGIRDSLVGVSPQHSTLGVIGLAVGEGQGEIELLRKILHAKGKDEDEHPAPKCVHYMAVDLSPVLLMCHLSNLRQAFSDEIKARRLIVSGVTESVFNLKDAIGRAREDAASRYSLERPEDFMPEGIGLLATYLGNCLGNQLPDPVEEVFVSVDAAFPSHRPLVLLLGVSVINKTKIEEYGQLTWEFFLQAPYHVLHNLRLLRGTDAEEFKLPCKLPALTKKDEASVKRFLEKRCFLRPPSTAGKPNLTLPFGFKVARYEFIYRPAGELRLARNQAVRRSAGDDIVLACIDKFDIESVRQVLEKKRYRVEMTTPVKTHSLGERDYEVLAVHFP